MALMVVGAVIGMAAVYCVEDVLGAVPSVV
jgi:hypothetical protein